MMSTKVNAEEYELAVLCMFELSSSCDSLSSVSMKEKAMAYCDVVKNSSECWQHNWNLFQGSSKPEARFYGLQVIQSCLSTDDVLNESQLLALRSEVLNWLRNQSSSSLQEEVSFVRTKLAVVLTLLIKKDYPGRWPSAFNDLLSLLPLGPGAIDLFLKVLQTIDEEIVAFNVHRSEPEIEKNTEIKDTMRVTSCMKDLFDAMHTILTTFHVTMPSLAESCLKTLEKYIGWVDIHLIASDRYVFLLFGFLKDSSSSLRMAACNCVYEIVTKGMEKQSKLELIEKLGILQIMTCLDLSDLEFAEEVAEVVNAIGLELMECIPTSSDGKALLLLEQLMPTVLGLFEHSEKAISEEVFELISLVCQMFDKEKQTFSHPFSPHDYLPQLMKGILMQLRYPETIVFGVMDEDEAQVESYRKNLKTIFVNVARVCPEEILSFLCEMVSNMLNKLETMHYVDLEAALALVYYYGEGVSKTPHYLAEGTPFPEMMAALHERLLPLHPHPSVLMIYYDLVVRYAQVLKTRNHLIPLILQGILGNQGLCHPHPKIRSRVAYLFLRLFKSIGSNVHLYSKEILSGLEIHLVVPQTEDDSKAPLRFQDQLHLFEIAGQLIGQAQRQYAEAILSPQILHMKEGLLHPALQTDPEAIAMWLGRVITAIGQVLKGFGKCRKDEEPLFQRTMTGAIQVLAALPQHHCIRIKLIFLTHRMVNALDKQLIPFLPNIMDPLIQHCQSKDILDLVQLINQVIIQYNQHILTFLDPRFMMIIQRFYQIMPSLDQEANTIEASTHAKTERLTIHKNMYSFLMQIVNSKLASLFLSPTNLPHLQPVLETIVQGCKDIPDMAINRSCFVIARMLLETWLQNNQITTITAESRDAFTNFAVLQFTAATFECPTREHFDNKDSLSILLWKAIVELQKALAKFLGVDFIRYVNDVYLPSIRCPPDVAAEYISALQNLPEEQFKSVLANQQQHHLNQH